MNPNPVGLILVGVLAGVLPGVFGFGGGWLLLPILTFVLGIPWSHASGLVFCAILAGAASGTANRLGRRCREPMPAEGRVRLVVVMIATFGSLIGKVGIRDGWLGPRSSPLVLDGIMAVALVGIAARYFYAAFGETYYGKREEPKLLLVGVALAALVPGVLSGVTGFGGGVLYVPILLWLLHWKKDNARDVSRMAVLWSALVGTALYARGGGVPLSDAAYLFVPSALVGALTSSIRFDPLDSDGVSARCRRTPRRPIGFDLLAGALAIVALILTGLHALGAVNVDAPPGGDLPPNAALAVGVPLLWGIGCGLIQRHATRFRERRRRDRIPSG
ncbi:MAG: sulfite exporter TauE/SafE family protein [Candidatus Latescibacterota bacterium]